jgi:hypothetical protein
MHEITHEPLNEFAWNLVLIGFTKLCLNFQLKLDNNMERFTWRPNLLHKFSFYQLPLLFPLVLSSPRWYRTMRWSHILKPSHKNNVKKLRIVNYLLYEVHHAISTSKCYQCLQNVHEPPKQRTAPAFLNYYKTYIDATCVGLCSYT